ncbi:MAG: undecaprenyl diphosphate synthase [Parcubacteria group bacterium]|nr:undecaprenyl diphosphate synthase [Parcubacteria group bacterium]
MSNVPQAIGVIMDGNRRWAKERNLPSLEGHRAGFEKMRELMQWSRDAGIKEVTIYAFSTENWNRAPEEVAYLMELFNAGFKTLLKDIREQEVRIRFVGDRDLVEEKLRSKMEEAEKESAGGEAGTLIIAFSYGGRPEILAATNKLLQEGRKEVTEADFKKAMWSEGLLDPDLIIRTGGEHRLSNFLTWQSVYSELFFTDTKWPDFSKEEFTSILTDFASRERRLGK